MRSIIIFVENQQRLNYLQKQQKNINKENDLPSNNFFKQTQKAFRGDDNPSLISRIKSIFNKQE